MSELFIEHNENVEHGFSKEFCVFYRKCKNGNTILKKSVDFCRGMWYDNIAWVCVGIFALRFAKSWEKEVLL